MCVAGLNVSTQPCAHRWYQLVRPCHPANNLANCPERLQLEGWEVRNESCPFCDTAREHTVHETTHRLFGSTSSASSVASATTTPETPTRTRYSRSGSSGTINSLSRESTATGSVPELDRGQMHREMNDRLLLYLTSDPHQVLPSARKNYPTYSGPSPRDDSSPSDAASICSSNGAFARGWSKGVRFGRTIFKN